MAKDDKRSAIVTGGSSGIGWAIASALGDRGYDVTICGRDEEKLDKAAKELGAAPFRCDVSKADDVEALFSAHTDRAGGLDVLVNNAGVAWGGKVEEIAEEDWDRVIDIDLKGVFLCTQRAVPLMREQGGGRVINISSVAGKRGMAYTSPYNAAKFGVIGLTESLIKEVEKEGILATAICPAMVDTPLVGGAAPAETLIRPEDIARTVEYVLDLSPMAAVREITVWRRGA